MIVADLSSQLDVEGVMSCCSGSGEDKFQKDHSARSQSTRMFQCLQSCSVGYGTYYSLFVRFLVAFVD